MIRRPPRSTRLTHSFPTRRSSDLQSETRGRQHGHHRHASSSSLLHCQRSNGGPYPGNASEESWAFISCTNPRSEEHTSELQSLMRISYAVFCLKKKK